MRYDTRSSRTSSGDQMSLLLDWDGARVVASIFQYLAVRSIGQNNVRAIATLHLEEDSDAQATASFLLAWAPSLGKKMVLDPKSNLQFLTKMTNLVQATVVVTYGQNSIRLTNMTEVLPYLETSNINVDSTAVEIQILGPMR